MDKEEFDQRLGWSRLIYSSCWEFLISEAENGVNKKKIMNIRMTAVNPRIASFLSNMGSGATGDDVTCCENNFIINVPFRQNFSSKPNYSQCTLFFDKSSFQKDSFPINFYQSISATYQ